jgi:hypothetical protein
MSVVPIRSAAKPRNGWLHVYRFPDGDLVVQHESASGNSFGLIARFGADELEQAVRCALNVLPDFPPSRLGQVALPRDLEPIGGRAA